MAAATPFPPQRRHTLHFLEAAARHRPVYLQAEVDMTKVEADRAGSAAVAGYTSYVVAAAARALAVHPDANAMILGGLRPRLYRFTGVDAKITLDKTIAGVRAVLSAVVSAADRKDPAGIQAEITALKAEDAEIAPRYAALRRLQQLPVVLGRIAYAIALRDPERRAALQGSFVVTSLGGGGVDTVLPMIAATTTFGVGRVRYRPIVLDGRIAAAPVMQLSLAFDHRVIDGALAADVLAATIDQLQRWPAATAKGKAP